MKLKELKHNHSLTDLLKVLIFSILMITPLLSVATRCLYVICNKNAYQSAEIEETQYDIDYQYKSNEVNNADDLVEGNIYKLTIDYSLIENYTNFLTTSFVKFDELELSASLFTNTENTTFELRKTSGRQIYVNYETVNYFMYTFRADTVEMYIVYDEILVNNITYSNFSISDYLGNPYLIENEGYTLDNVFEYSVNKLAESAILSWTQQTAIYTGVNTMTTQLGVNTPTIPMLIVYWFLLTVIYIIIDIIIKLFTWLTHMIGSKSV